MAPMAVVDLLTTHRFVADLPTSRLHRLATAGRPAFYRAGTRLFRPDTVADRFWLMHGGTVAIDLTIPGRGDVVLERVGPGTAIGWSWSRPPYRWRFGAVVAEDFHGVEFDAIRLRRLMTEEPDLGAEIGARLLEVVAARLEAARHRVADLYAYPSPSFSDRP